ncbi:TPA: Gfo/Idh/MocA family oxidoreductase [bacterium]|nr:Gfo/Idh/MocA family oxidoreductase [bacterium]
MEQKREIGFGVVGLGMGAYHVDAISKSKGAKLIAICDVDEDRLNKTNEKYKVKTYKNYDDMVNDKEVEVINVCSPSYLHVDMAIQAVRAGKHVIVEKPVDISVDKINMLIEEGKKAGVKMSGIFQSRTTPLNKRIKDAIDKGRLGKLIGVHCSLPWYRAQSYYEGPHGSWKGTWDKDGGGSLMNQGVHSVDLLQWFGGKVKSVFGSFGVFAHDISAEDNTVAVLKFQNGALGTLLTSTCVYPGLSQQILIYGDKGTIAKDEDQLKTWKIISEREKEEEAEMLSLYGPSEKRGETTASDPMAVGSSGHIGIIEDIVQAIHEDRDTIITIESAKHAVEIVNAIYESGRTGKEVNI